MFGLLYLDGSICVPFNTKAVKRNVPEAVFHRMVVTVCKPQGHCDL